MKISNSRFISVLCVFCCISFCVMQVNAYTSPHSIVGGSGTIGYNCIYETTPCNALFFVNGWGHTIQATWICTYAYQLTDDGTGMWWKTGDAQMWECTETFNGCCTMPNNATCATHAESGEGMPCSLTWDGDPPDE